MWWKIFNFILYIVYYTLLLNNIILYSRHVQNNKWSEALNLCRSSNDQCLWACLAVLATQSNDDVYDIAEECYANIGHYDKVFYIQNVKVTVFYVLKK